MQAIADREGAGIRIAPWDYRYYAEKVRKAKYDLDANEVKPYLQLDKLRDGMFWVAGKIFGFRFSPVQGVPVYHPDVVVYEVKDAAGRHVGLWYFDPWARPGKRSGAWMNAYRDQERFDGEVPTIVSNNSNFVQGRGGRAGARELGRRHDDVPRVRPRPPRPELERHLPLALRNVRGSRLRGVPLADPRTLARDAGSPGTLCPALPHRPAPARRAGAEDRAGLDLPPGLRHGRVPGECPRRHEAPPRRRPADRPRRLRAGHPRRAGPAVRDRDAPPNAAVHARLLGRRIRGRLLQLPLVGRAGRRRLGGLHRGGRAVGRGGGEAPARERLLGREHHRSRGRLPRVPRPGRPDRRPHAQARLPGPDGRPGPTDRPGAGPGKG